MCTFYIDDTLVDPVRSSFKDETDLNKWMTEQMTVILRNFANTPKQASTARRAHKHDVLMGIIKDTPEIDYREVHLREKYGI